MLIAICAVGACGAGGESFAEFVFALFVFFENFTGAFDDAARETGEAGDFDAVTFIGGAGFDAAKKNDFAGSFFHGNVNVGDAGEEIRKIGEFVIVGGEKSAGASVFVQVFDDGPGDGKAVKRGSAAANFVEEDEARRSGVVENGGDF